MSPEEALKVLRKRMREYEEPAGFAERVLPALLDVVEAAEEYKEEKDNPVPDYTLRNHLFQNMARKLETLAAAVEREVGT